MTTQVSYGEVIVHRNLKWIKRSNLLGGHFSMRIQTVKAWCVLVVVEYVSGGCVGARGPCVNARVRCWCVTQCCGKQQQTHTMNTNTTLHIKTLSHHMMLIFRMKTESPGGPKAKNLD